ncbi:MAG: hypothetical protein LBD60_01600 [Puniceicoccales bacterium]|jgi:hypothetical protein|nr:hypothetical protein [Puniceicoccales bacterium]
MSASDMGYCVFNKKVRLITFSLIIPFQINLQASAGGSEVDFVAQHRRWSTKVVRVLRERESPVCPTIRSTLTPKEIQIASLARCRFFQLKNNNPACKSPSIGLWTLTRINQQIHNGEVVMGQPVSIVYNRLLQIATQICPNDHNPLNASVESSLVQQIAKRINKPILFIEVGNKGCSWGPGALDITKRLIFAKPNELENNDERDLENDWDNENEEVLVQHTWFKDNELLNTIGICGPNSVIICYNSYLGRTVFSLPRNPNLTTAQESDAWIPPQQKTAILNIGRNRIIRNIGIFVITAAGIYAVKTLLWPMVMSSQIADYFRGLVKSRTPSEPSPTPIPSESPAETPSESQTQTPSEPSPSPILSESPAETPSESPVQTPSEPSPSPTPIPEPSPSPSSEQKQ